VKSICFALFLSALGAWAQTADSTPAAPNTAQPAVGRPNGRRPKPAANAFDPRVTKLATNNSPVITNTTPAPVIDTIITPAPVVPAPPTTAPPPLGDVVRPAVPVTTVPGATPLGTVTPFVPGTSTSPNTTAAVPSGPAARPAVPNPAAPPVTPGAVTPGAVTPAAATAPPPGAPNSLDEVMPTGAINFPATDLKQVLDIYSKLVGRTILRPATLPAPTITLITETPLTKREIIQAFDAVLGLNGIGVVNIGDKFVKIVPLPQVTQVGMPFTKETPDQFPDLGQFVTTVIQVTNVKPTEMVSILTPFASAGVANGILPIDGSSILILRDFSENVKRMLEMIRKVDVPYQSEFVSEVIPIKYALSSDIASALNSLSSGGGGTTLGGGGGAAAGVRPGGTGSRYGSGSGTGFGRQGMGTGYPGSTMPGNSPFGAQATTAPGQTPGAGGSSFTQRLQNIINRASTGGSGDIQVIGVTKIISDERTNSLLVFATREDMKTIKEIVAKLDVVLAQVLIEAVILQVSLNNSRDLGISYVEQRPHGIGDYFSGLGVLNNKNILSGTPLLGNATTNAAGNLPGGFTYLATLGNDLNVWLTAVAAGSKARILQRPRIQTSHAVPATLFVGQQRPYPVSSYYGGGAFGGYASIQQLQIGVTLEVTPLINPDGLVVMDIHQKIDSFEGNVTIQNVGDVPVTSSKDATAKVAVRDRDTIMLGGLIETDKNSNNSGIPLLKDLPLLGALFRSSSTSDSRTELMVLIRPTVLPTPEIAALAARSEQSKMPEVKAWEKEMEREETKRLNNMDAKAKGTF
jgi:general secretion pathway protein D